MEKVFEVYAYDLSGNLSQLVGVSGTLWFQDKRRRISWNATETLKIHGDLIRSKGAVLLRPCIWCGINKNKQIGKDIIL